MTVFILKIIAVFCMICDHIRYVIPNLDIKITRLLGRIAFPIFAFFISEGYCHTKNIKRYLIRLGIFSLVSEIPFLLFIIGCNIEDEIGLNVIFTLLFGAIAILSYDKIENKIFKILSIIGLISLAQITNMDYGASGVILILIFYIFKDKRVLKNVLFLILFIGGLVIRCEFQKNRLIYCIPYFIGYTISAILLYNYNGKVGKYKLKYFFYFFYPVHMVLLYLIYGFIN